MRSIHDIKTRINTVKNIEQTTKAIKLISTAKMGDANNKYLNNSRYFKVLRQTLKDILIHKGDIEHKYLKHRPSSKAAFVVIASDTSMAGDYNFRVLNFAFEKINEYKEEKFIYTIGQQAADFFARNKIPVEKRFLTYAKDLKLRYIRNITAFLVNEYNEEKIDEINIIYTYHQENRLNKVEMLRLLPILKEDFINVSLKESNESNVDYEPSAKEVFNIVAPQYIFGLTYSCIVQAVKCEHEERQEAMHTASNNAKEMLGDLELSFHRARQEQITTELLEISSESSRINKK